MAYDRVLGLPPQGLLGKALGSVLHPDDAPKLGKLLKEALLGNSYQVRAVSVLHASSDTARCVMFSCADSSSGPFALVLRAVVHIPRTAYQHGPVVRGALFSHGFAWAPLVHHEGRVAPSSGSCHWKRYYCMSISTLLGL